MQSTAYEIARRAHEMRQAIFGLMNLPAGSVIPGVVVNDVLYTVAYTGDTARACIRIDEDGNVTSYPIAYRPGHPLGRAPHWQFKNGKVAPIDFEHGDFIEGPLYVCWDRSLGAEVAYSR